MVWSNWQGAIWRGAMLVLLFGSGLAWTQPPAQVPSEGAERIMVVHENGKAARCRVLETWQLPDRRIAHLLQSTETGEMITIVDEHPPTGDAGDVKNAKSMSKRIYSWGTGRRTPPDGSPIPPQLRLDSKDDSHPVKRVAETQVVELNPPANPNVVKPLPKSLPLPLQVEVLAQQPPVQQSPVQNPPLQQPQIIVEEPCTTVGPTIIGQPATFPRLQAVASRLRSNGAHASTTFEPAGDSRIATQTTIDPNITIVHEHPPGTIIEAKNSWRPGDKLQAWLMNRSTPKSSERMQAGNEGMAQENMIPSKNKTAFSTAMSMPAPELKKPETSPLAMGSKAIDEKPGALPDTNKPPVVAKPDMWGVGPNTANTAPGKSLVDGTKKVDPLLAPERITPNDDKVNAKAATLPPAPRPNEGFPLNSQSVLAARSGLQGPVTYIPYAIVTVPQPHQPPMPPAPKLPDAPNLTAYVNAFTPPPAPKGQANPGQPGMMAQGNPMLAQQQMMQQQMMMQQMMQQQMMQQQMAQQHMMPNGNPAMPVQYRQPMPSQGPTANGARQYQGPLPPNLTGANAPMQAGYVPMANPAMMPLQPAFQPVGHQQPMPAQPTMAAQQIDQLIRAMRESPYPTQREWAAQQLVSFEWRTNPQLIHALLQSAAHDPAASVRAGCVYCLGRMQASVEPVLGTLNALRNDTDPRVRQEVEKAFVRFGHTPQ